MTHPSTRTLRALAALALAGGLLATSGLGATRAQAAPSAAPGVSAATDTDGDSLPDAWETDGYDADGDGVVDVDLPALGASPTHKDLFVEMDYMQGRLASATALGRIVQVFAGAPVSNPDGTSGITIHLDAGSARGTAYDLGGGNQVPYDSNLSPAEGQTQDIKSGNFDAARAKIFYYMLWADDYTDEDGNRCSSGNAFDIPNDTFIVTMGPACGWTPDDDMNVGTFVHELGHDLGLLHGGADSDNYKPNYLSVMNYAFQFHGVPRYPSGSYFGYSNVNPPALNETDLRESAGLGTTAVSGWRTTWFCPNGSQRTTSGAASGAIDWNCDGDTLDRGRWNINGDKTTSGGTRLTSLRAQDNWANITFGGGTVGAGSPRGETSVDAPREATKQQWRRLDRAHRH